MAVFDPPKTLYITTDLDSDPSIITGVTSFKNGERLQRKGTYRNTGWPPGKVVMWPDVTNAATGASAPQAIDMPVRGVPGATPVFSSWSTLRHAPPDEVAGIPPRSLISRETGLLVCINADGVIPEAPDPVFRAKVFTAATTDVCTSTAHGFANRDQVTVSTSNTLPTGLSSLLIYELVKIDADTFKLAFDGAIVDISSTGTGAHTVTLYEPATLAANHDEGILFFPDLWNPRVSFVDPRD